MRAPVTDQGILIPKDLLNGWTEVVIERKGDHIEIKAAGGVEEDPALGLGRSPVRLGIADGSTEHDQHIHRP